MQRQVCDSFRRFQICMLQQRRDLAKVKHCLKAGTNIDSVLEKLLSGYYKATGSDEAMVTFLIQHRANINAWSIDGTPLDFAIKNKHFDIEQLLREHGGKTGKN